MASVAVSLCWWSYRSSLSSRSRASGLTRCWFSDWTNCSQRFRVCLEGATESGGYKAATGLKRAPTTVTQPYFFYDCLLPQFFTFSKYKRADCIRFPVLLLQLPCSEGALACSRTNKDKRPLWTAKVLSSWLPDTAGTGHWPPAAAPPGGTHWPSRSLKRGSSSMWYLRR